MKVIMGAVFSLAMATCSLAGSLEVQVETTGELKVLFDGKHIGTNQIYVSMAEGGVTYGQSIYQKQFSNVEINQEGDDWFITGEIPGVLSMLERVSVSESAVRIDVSLKFAADTRLKVYSNYSLYGLEAPLDQVKVSDESGAEMALEAEPDSSAAESKLLVDQRAISVIPASGVAFEVKTAEGTPMFLSDARRSGGFFYLGLQPVQDGNVINGGTLSYSYEISVKK